MSSTIQKRITQNALAVKKRYHALLVIFPVKAKRNYALEVVYKECLNACLLIASHQILEGVLPYIVSIRG